jgi:hypothetical protein
MTEARSKVAAAFRTNLNLDTNDVPALEVALSRGRFVLAELRALQSLHKYRYVKPRDFAQPLPRQIDLV